MACFKSSNLYCDQKSVFNVWKNKSTETFNAEMIQTQVAPTLLLSGFVKKWSEKAIFSFLINYSFKRANMANLDSATVK